MKKELVNQLIYGFMRVALLPVFLILFLAGVIYAEPTNGQGILNRRVSLTADQQVAGWRPAGFTILDPP